MPSLKRHVINATRVLGHVEPIPAYGGMTVETDRAIPFIIQNLFCG